MNTRSDDVKIGVFDPSNRLDGKYWQWSSLQIDDLWNNVASQVHKGWPVKVGDFNDQQARLYGVIDNGVDPLWLYRVYPAGRDSIGRSGRYFFVLFRLSSPEQIMNPLVAGVIHYFEGERGLPLNVKPLEGELPSSPDNHALTMLHNECGRKRRPGHWGMDERGTIIQFTEKPAPTVDNLAHLPAARLPTSSGVTRKVPPSRQFIFGLVIGIVIGFMIGHRADGPLESKSPKSRPDKPEETTVRKPKSDDKLSPSEQPAKSPESTLPIPESNATTPSAEKSMQSTDPSQSLNHERPNSEVRLKKSVPAGESGNQSPRPDRQDNRAEGKR